ncbi:MAG: hypothetical protein E6Q89_08660 [Bacteroidia bacterium]|nr:MAG: hypothetical protein E6Q89_08660 [Bacteroidia bacterium]
MKLFKSLEKSFSFWFLLVTSFLFFILRWPSLFEPYWYGDEGIYQAVGMLINSGEQLYIGAWDNKPPLLYVLYAIFGSDQFALRTLSLIFGLVSIWIFYFLAKKLFPKNKWAAVASTLFYAFFFGSRIIEGNIANAENFMLLPIVASAYLIYSGEFIKKSLLFKNYFLAGVIISFAFLTKIVAVFDLLALSVFLLIDPEKDLKEKLKTKALAFIIGFSLPVLIVTLYFLFTGNIKGYMDGSLFSNINYVGYGNKFIIPQGLLYIKTILLFAFIGFLYLRRKTIDRAAMFVLVWFAFSLFSAFFSQRPYTHYLLMLLPSISLLIGAIIELKRERVFIITVFFVGYIIINNSFNFFDEKFLNYYSNLVSFCQNKKDVNSYQSFFDPITPRDYELARYINMNTQRDESIFIWGNNAQLYKLTNKTPLLRYTVAYHITGYPTGIEEMKNAIDKKKPELIIVMPNVGEFPYSLNNYQEKINIGGAIVYEKIF